MFEIICRVGPDKGGRWEIIDDDPIVPHAHGKALYDLAPEPKRFVSVEGADHNDLIGVYGVDA